MEHDQKGAGQEPQHPVHQLVDEEIEREKELMDEVVARRASIAKQLAEQDARLARHKQRYDALCRWKEEAK